MPSAGGVPISMPVRPAAADCDALVRREVGVAVAARAALGSTIAATLQAATDAADDPDADLLSYGIPLTQTEVKLLTAAGVWPDPVSVIAYWTATHPMNFSAPNLSGGTLTVTVRKSEAGILAETRCFESGSILDRVRYVTAPTATRSELDALLARIAADRNALRAQGVEITTAWTDETTGVVVVGVKTMTVGIAAKLIAAYGPFVEPVQHDGFIRTDG